MRRLCRLVLLFPLAACASGTPTAGSSPGALYAQLTTDGVSGVTAATPYGSHALRDAMPGFKIKPIQTARETRVEPALAAFKDGVQVVEFFKGADGKIAEIHGVTTHLEGPHGEWIGMSMRQAGVSRRSCRVGQDLWRGMAVCPDPYSKNVTLVFSIPGYAGPFDELPSAEALQNAALERMIWQAG